MKAVVALIVIVAGLAPLKWKFEKHIDANYGSSDVLHYAIDLRERVGRYECADDDGAQNRQC